MKTLIVYDLEGNIIQRISGSYRKPVGVPHIEVDIPEGKMVTGVNVNIEPNQPIIENLPPNENELLNKKTDELEQAILELTMMVSVLQGGIK